MDGFSGKVALVTGAASGIGRETALALAREGAELILCDVDAEGLAKVRAAVERDGTCRLAEVVDVGDREAMGAFAGRVHGEVGPLDLLVNNAGVGVAGGLLDTSLADWDHVVHVNLWGVIHGCHFFVPPMVERGRGGHVVNVASAAGYFATPDFLAYAATKFGVVGLSEAMRAELGPHRVGVTVICPGVIDTGIIATTRFRGKGDPEARRAQVQRFYEKRGYGPEKVARAILRAVRKNRAVVPVTPEAWLLYYMKRLAPTTGAKLAQLGARRSGLGS